MRREGELPRTFDPAGANRKAIIVGAMQRNDCDVAVIGAGPFGLAAAAHLKSANIETRVFGEPMSFWRHNMPQGMRLRSPWIASHIAHPENEHSLDAYAAVRGFAPHEQMLVDDFISYGCWFQQKVVPDVDTRKVRSVEQTHQTAPTVAVANHKGHSSPPASG